VTQLTIIAQKEQKKSFKKKLISLKFHRKNLPRTPQPSSRTSNPKNEIGGGKEGKEAIRPPLARKGNIVRKEIFTHPRPRLTTAFSGDIQKGKLIGKGSPELTTTKEEVKRGRGYVILMVPSLRGGKVKTFPGKKKGLQKRYP